MVRIRIRVVIRNRIRVRVRFEARLVVTFGVRGRAELRLG